MYCAQKYIFDKFENESLLTIQIIFIKCLVIYKYSLLYKIYQLNLNINLTDSVMLWLKSKHSLIYDKPFPFKTNDKTVNWCHLGSISHNEFGSFQLSYAVISQ